MTKPRTYTVLTFRKNDDGTRSTAVHVVAAFTSDEAEAEFRAAAPDVMAGCECFIVTDAIRDHAPDGNVYLWVQRYDGKSEDRVTEQAYRAWVRAVTRHEWHDGEPSFATHRRMTAVAAVAA